MKELFNFILDLLTKKSPEQPIAQPLIECISLEKFFMGRDQSCSSELTPDVTKSAIDLLHRVNGLLNELSYLDNYSVSSGWRPPSINSKTPNSAKRSLHMVGKAIDIHDDSNQSLCKKILNNPGLLRKYGLWMEDYKSTRGWCHLDSGIRSERQVRTFKP